MNPLYARRRLLGRNVYKKTVEGNPAIAQGSLARMYPGIKMNGWTEQAQYEGKNLFDISDFETNNKGIIENGTILFKQSLGTVTYYLSLSPGTYSISIKRSGHSGITIKVNEVAVINNGGGNNFTNNFDVSDGDSVVLEFSEGQNPNGEDRMIYDIMLNSGSTALPYEPYTGGAPSPSPDYPQEIVSAGKYNEDTQKWEYEITIANEQTDPDKNQTVLITSDRPLTKWDRLEKRNGQWGWGYKSAEVVLDGSEYWMLYTNNKSENLYGFQHNISNLVIKNTSEERGFIDKIPSISQGISSTNKMAAQFGSFNTTLYILLPREYFGDHSVNALTEWLSENPLMVLYETEEETFVPLSESEQEQMNELYTFRPTTVLSNDCGCNMTLTYKTKKSLEVTT